MTDRHLHQPVNLRLPADDRAWWLERAKEAGLAVGTVAEQRAALRKIVARTLAEARERAEAAGSA